MDTGIFFSLVLVFASSTKKAVLVGLQVELNINNKRPNLKLCKTFKHNNIYY